MPKSHQKPHPANYSSSIFGTSHLFTLSKLLPKRKLFYLFFITSTIIILLQLPGFIKRLARDSALKSEFLTYQAINILKNSIEDYQISKNVGDIHEIEIPRLSFLKENRQNNGNDDSSSLESLKTTETPLDQEQNDPDFDDSFLKNHEFNQDDFEELMVDWKSNFLSIAPDSIKVYHEPIQKSTSGQIAAVQNVKSNDENEWKLYNLPIDQLTSNFELKIDSKILFSEPNTCKFDQKERENTKIFFLKTHKTASSTIQNILFRYGDKYDLKFALPKIGNRFGYPQYVNRRHVRQEDKFNIVCNHMRYQKGILDYLYYSKSSDQVSKNRPQVAKITILREPASLFESSFGYFKANANAFKKAPSLDEFLDNPTNFYIPNEKNNNQFYFFAHNHMMFDLGFDPELSDENSIYQAVESVKNTYDLVLITEYFEESMILLKHLLCLGENEDDYEDVAFLISNARVDSTKKELSEKQKYQIYNWNKADSILYKELNETFWKVHVENFGAERMAREKIKLQKKNEEIRNLCFVGETNDQNYAKETGQFRPSANTKMKSYVLKTESENIGICADISRPELKYSAKLLKKQYPDWTSFY